MNTIRFHKPYQSRGVVAPAMALTLNVDLDTPEPETDEYKRMRAPGIILAHWIFQNLTSAAINALTECLAELWRQNSGGDS